MNDELDRPGMPRHRCTRCGQPHLVANGPICLGCQAADANEESDDERLGDIAEWIGGNPARFNQLADVLQLALSERAEAIIAPSRARR